jgi:hypothetical protein
MVWQRPGLIGSPGWVRSSAWIWLFSSIDSTTAWAGGSDPRIRLVAGPRAGSELGDVGQLGDETGVVRALEGAQAVRLRFVTPNRSAAPNPARCRWLWPSPGRSSGSPGAAVRRQSLPSRKRGSMPPPAPWFPPRSAPCRACGSCRAINPRPRSRRSVVATATPSAG